VLDGIRPSSPSPLLSVSPGGPSPRTPTSRLTLLDGLPAICATGRGIPGGPSPPDTASGHPDGGSPDPLPDQPINQFPQAKRTDYPRAIFGRLPNRQPGVRVLFTACPSLAGEPGGGPACLGR
jgi:hypothetical protein